MRFNYYCILPLLTLPVLSLSSFAQDTIIPDLLPKDWQYTEGIQQTLPTDDAWWENFGDQTLDSLIAIGVSNNYNLLTAKHRIEMSRQSLRKTQSQYYPTIGINGGWSAQRSSGVSTNKKMDASELSYFDLGASMNWQIDLFGKISAQSRMGKAQYDASRAEYDAMMVTISAKIASAYMQLRMLQAQKAVLNAHIAQQKRVSDITQARHDVGLASMLDVTQSLTIYYSTLASLTNIDTSISTTINSIAILLGVYPQQIRDTLLKDAPMPDYHQIVAIGMPMDLIRRRPDIAEAEYTLAGYAAALGVAKKDFLPTLTLNGSIGTMAHDISDMFSQRSITYSIAPTLSWTIFDGMRRKAGVASAEEQMMIGIETYNNTVLTAVQEVDNAITTYYNDLSYIDTISNVVAQSQKSFELSIDLYKQGLTDFINVSNAQISFLQYANELVSAQGQALIALVNLYEALGGGWSQS